jgi:hypothetical protein
VRFADALSRSRRAGFATTEDARHNVAYYETY